MSPREQAAYNAGIKAAINAAQIVAITVQTGDVAGTLRKRVAAETLAAFAEAAEGLKLGQGMEALATTASDRNASSFAYFEKASDFVVPLSSGEAR